MDRNKTLLGLSALLVFAVLTVSYSQFGKRNIHTTTEQGVYTNTEYGFQIAASSSPNTLVPTEGENPWVNQKQIQYAIDENITVTIVRNTGASTYADALSANAGSYLTQRKKVIINNKEAEYLQMGFANNTKTYNYIFNKGPDSIVVSIHIPDTESPQSIINSFVF